MKKKRGILLGGTLEAAMAAGKAKRKFVVGDQRAPRRAVTKNAMPKPGDVVPLVSEPPNPDWYVSLSTPELLETIRKTFAGEWDNEVTRRLAHEAIPEMIAEANKRGVVQAIEMPKAKVARNVVVLQRQVFPDGSTQCPKCNRLIQSEAQLSESFGICLDCVRAGIEATDTFRTLKQQIESVEKARSALTSACAEFSCAWLATNRDPSAVDAAVRKIVTIASAVGAGDEIEAAAARQRLDDLASGRRSLNEDRSPEGWAEG